MSAPDVNVTIKDGGLGALAGSSQSARALIGVCSDGEPGRVYAFTSKDKLVETLGLGPLVEAAAHSLQIAGGPVYCVRVEANVAAILSDVEHDGTGPAVTVAGEGVDDYFGQIIITKGGAIGTARFKFSLDGGKTFSAEYLVPNAPYPVGDSGITATFASGTYVEGEQYEFSSGSDKYDSSAFVDALDVLLADSRQWGFVHAVGPHASAEASAAIASALATALAEAEQNHRYAFGLVDAAGGDFFDASGEPTEIDADTDLAAIVAAFSDVADSRLYIAGGIELLTSPITGYQQARPVGWSHGARIAAIAIHVDPGAFADGPTKGVTALSIDEGVLPGLDEAGIASSRTYVGEAGYYVTRGRMKAPAGSDFTSVDRRRVMDEGCRVARSALLFYLNGTVKVDATTGFIDDLDARRIESRVKAQLKAALVAPGHASSVEVEVPRDENILSTEQLSCSIRIVPLGKTTYIEATIGLENPALAAT